MTARLATVRHWLAIALFVTVSIPSAAVFALVTDLGVLDVIGRLR